MRRCFYLKFNTVKPSDGKISREKIFYFFNIRSESVNQTIYMSHYIVEGDS